MSIVIDDVTHAPARVITIANARRGNALTKPMLRALAAAFRDVPSDVRGIILRGDSSASASFCAGIDLASAAEVFATPEDALDDDPVHHIERCALPVIAACHGAAINAGFELALSCDVVVATNDATFVDTHAAIGIVPSWGLSVKLSRVIGANAARAVSVFGEPLTSARARELGFATERACEDAAEATTEAARLMRRVFAMPAGGAAAIKRAIHDGLAIDGVRAEERRRAFAQYREEAGMKFKAFREARARSKM
jgi:enoyl-CoA hydratase/carnithine racemase